MDQIIEVASWVATGVLALLALVLVITILLYLISLLLQQIWPGGSDGIDNFRARFIDSWLWTQNMVKYPLLLILLAAVVFYGYRNFDSLNRPIAFEKEYQRRSVAVIERLKDIRTSQLAYKSFHGRYADNFDSLLHFVINDSLLVIRSEGTVDDSLLDKYPFAEALQIALKRGYVLRDTTKIKTLDSLFKGDKNRVAEMPLIPYSGGSLFELEAATLLTNSGASVEVFEVRAPNQLFMKGMDIQLIAEINTRALVAGRYAGLKVGDLSQPNNNEGNWE